MTMDFNREYNFHTCNLFIVRVSIHCEAFLSDRFMKQVLSDCFIKYLFHVNVIV